MKYLMKYLIAKDLIYLIYLIYLIVFLTSFSVYGQEESCYELFGRLGSSVHQGQSLKGEIYRGVIKANSHLEKQGFWREFESVKDFGEIEVDDSFGIYETLFNKTLSILEEKRKPLLIGGDHSQSFSTVSAILKHYPDLKVLWVDAHADINTRNTSPSNNIHGMPVAGLMGLMAKEPWNKTWLLQKLKSENIIYLGIRDLDEGEKEFIRKHNIESYSSKLIKEKGIRAVLQEIKRKWKDEPVHISFDIDSLDDFIAPATGTPVPEGLSLEDSFEIIKTMKSHLVSFELVEFNPDLAESIEDLQKTEKAVKEVLRSLLKP